MRLSLPTLYMCPLLIGIVTYARAASPEVALQQALSDLKNIEHQLEASEKVLNSQLSGPQKLSAKNSFSHAQDLFKQAQYLACTRQLANYLNQTQVPATEQHMAAQFALGRSYEELGLSDRALRAYTRYIATFTTAPKSLRNYEELTAVMKRSIPLAAKANGQSKTRLNSLFAAVLSMSMPKERKAEVYYFAAANTDRESLAKEWFAKAKATSSDDAIDSRANYFLALIALRSSELKKAEKLLNENLKIRSDSGKEFADLSRLALARVALRQRKLDLAERYYASITPDSASYRDALFELMYLYLDTKQNTQARKAAQNLIERFPNHSQSFQAKVLMSYLDLRAGNVSEAKVAMQAANNDLTRLKGWITQRYSQRKVLYETDVKRLMTETDKHIEHSPTIKTAFQIFSRLNQQRHLLSTLRSDIRDLLFNLGRMNMKEFRPEWVNRSNQLNTLSEETLLIGHKLISTYRFLFRDQLDSVENQALEASEQRRFRLFSHAAQLARLKRSWSSWVTSVQLIHDAAKQAEKIRRIRAQIGAARFLASNRVFPARNSTLRSLAVLNQKAEQIESVLNSSIELIRRFQFLDQVRQGPYTSTMRLHRQYANLLYEEAAIISAYFRDLQSPNWRFVVQDAVNTWRRWEYVSSVVFEKLSKLEKDVSTRLKESVSKLDKYIRKHDDLVDRSGSIRHALEEVLGASLGSSLTYYRTNIRERMAKHQKWRADIDWIEYEQLNNEDQALDRRLELQEQILKDNLRDLRQGVIW